MAQTVGHYYKLRVFTSTYIHRLPSLVSCKKSDSVRPREQITQVVDNSNIQEVASGRDAGCGSAALLVMTIMSVRVGSAVSVVLCVSVSDVNCRSSIASSIFILMASTRDERVNSLQVRPYQTASQSCRNIPGARWLSIRIRKNSLA